MQKAYGKGEQCLQETHGENYEKTQKAMKWEFLVSVFYISLLPMVLHMILNVFTYQ